MKKVRRYGIIEKIAEEVFMDKTIIKKRAGTAVDVLMYAILLVQMLYVFAGNTLHEILGIILFVCLVFPELFQRCEKNSRPEIL